MRELGFRAERNSRCSSRARAADPDRDPQREEEARGSVRRGDLTPRIALQLPGFARTVKGYSR